MQTSVHLHVPPTLPTEKEPPPTIPVGYLAWVLWRREKYVSRAGYLSPFTAIDINVKISILMLPAVQTECKKGAEPL
jgi:hypothetical protein